MKHYNGRDCSKYSFFLLNSVVFPVIGARLEYLLYLDLCYFLATSVPFGITDQNYAVCFIVCPAVLFGSIFQRNSDYH